MFVGQHSNTGIDQQRYYHLAGSGAAIVLYGLLGTKNNFAFQSKNERVKNKLGKEFALITS